MLGLFNILRSDIISIFFGTQSLTSTQENFCDLVTYGFCVFFIILMVRFVKGLYRLMFFRW